MALMSLAQNTARTAHLGDAETIVTIYIEAYCLDKDDAKTRQFARSFSQSPEQFRVLESDGEIVSFVQIEKDLLRIGRSVIVRGNVGNVACRPCHQGKGYASELLEDVLEWMKIAGYDLARLGGYVHYYSRFGWSRFPRYYLELSLEERLGSPTTFTDKRLEEYGLDLSYSYKGAGWSVLTRNLLLPEEHRSSVRRFDARRDSTICADIYREFTRYCNRVERSEAQLADLFNNRSPELSFVFIENNVVVGFVLAMSFETDRTEFEANITIATIAARDGHLNCIEVLLRQILEISCQKGFSRVTARIPLDRRLDSALEQIPVSSKRVEYMGGLGSNMLQITSLHNLFKHLRPELEQRYSNSQSQPYTWEGTLRFQTRKETVSLGVGQGKITVFENYEGESLVIDIEESNLLRLVFGILSFEELFKNEDFGVAEFSLLKDLFTRQSCMSDVIG
jgi:predicted N-acetyltransferase YhbS